MSTDAIKEKLEAVWKNKGLTCPICGHGKWIVSDVCALKVTDGLVYPGAPTIPLIPVRCEGCGNTLLFNAIQVGVVSQRGKRLV